MRRSGDLVTWWCHDPTRDRAPGFALRIIGPLRSVDQPDRRTAPRGPDDQANRGAAQRGRVSHPRSRKGYTSTSVRKLLSRCELTHGRIGTRQLDRHEWWLPDLARRFKCQWTSCASGRDEAGFARGRSRREVCGSSGPMGGNDADCGSSWQTRVRASLRNKRRHEEGYQF